MSKITLRYVVQPCDNAGTTEGKQLVWTIWDRVREVSVGDHDTRTVARRECRTWNREHAEGELAAVIREIGPGYHPDKPEGDYLSVVQDQTLPRRLEAAHDLARKCGVDIERLAVMVASGVPVGTERKGAA